MTLEVSINIGFITNSSSVVHHFPRELLELPEIKEFLRVMGIDGGYVGRNLWNRGECATIAITREEKLETLAELRSINEDGDDYTVPEIDVDGDTVVIVYGDEYESVASTLASMLSQIAHDMGLAAGYEDYN